MGGGYCKNGHLIVGDNARICNNGKSVRCIQCQRKNIREFMRKKRKTNPRDYRIKP